MTTKLLVHAAGDWQDLLSEQVRQLEAETGDPALATKAIALLRVNRFYEQRVRQLTLKADYRLARSVGYRIETFQYRRLCR